MYATIIRKRQPTWKSEEHRWGSIGSVWEGIQGGKRGEKMMQFYFNIEKTLKSKNVFLYIHRISNQIYVRVQNTKDSQTNFA